MPYWFLGQRQSKGFAGSFTRDDGSAVFFDPKACSFSPRKLCDRFEV